MYLSTNILYKDDIVLFSGFMSSCSSMDYTGQGWTKMEQYDHASSYQLLPSSLEQASHYHAQHRHNKKINSLAEGIHWKRPMMF